jgi:hypothetical protein
MEGRSSNKEEINSKYLRPKQNAHIRIGNQYQASIPEPMHRRPIIDESEIMEDDCNDSNVLHHKGEEEEEKSDDISDEENIGPTKKRRIINHQSINN